MDPEFKEAICNRRGKNGHPFTKPSTLALCLTSFLPLSPQHQSIPVPAPPCLGHYSLTAWQLVPVTLTPASAFTSGEVLTSYFPDHLLVSSLKIEMIGVLPPGVVGKMK